MSLHDSLAAFSDGLIHQGGAAADLILGPRGLDPAAALAIYRNNVFANYRRALAASYPVVLRLISEDCFHHTVDALVRAQASDDGDVARYGARLPDFLAQHDSTRGLPWLAHVAHLEWAIEEAAGAAECPAFDPAVFAQVDPDALGQLRIGLHPSLRLIASTFPLLRIWRSNQADGEAEVIDLDHCPGEHLLVLRRPDGVDLELLSQAEHAWLQALAEGRSLGEATDTALATDSDFDLPAALVRHALGGSFATAHL